MCTPVKYMLRFAGPITGVCPKEHLDRFSCFWTANPGRRARVVQSYSPGGANVYPQLISGSLGAHKPVLQTTYPFQSISFRVSRRRRETAACLQYCTDPDVTWGSGRGCPLVVHYWADLQSVHGMRCYGNIMKMRSRAQR